MKAKKQEVTKASQQVGDSLKRYQRRECNGWEERKE